MIKLIATREAEDTLCYGTVFMLMEQIAQRLQTLTQTCERLFSLRLVFKR